MASAARAVVDFTDEHLAFAASRSSEYLYETGSEAAFAALDAHAEAPEGEARLPLVVAGGSGCGKSALLANWVLRRREVMHRGEFLFEHFIGCSPRSRELAHLLQRLESGLKEHFQLREMEVPTSEERLRWSLNRFLAAAARKASPARICIVLDAVDRLRGESTAATLHWLPTQLPPGVRIIVSTVELEPSASPSRALDGDEGARVHRTYTELQRRKCPTIRLQPLAVEVRHAIICAFIAKSPKLRQKLDEPQQIRLVTAKASAQPLFLRCMLYALAMGVELSETALDMQIDYLLRADTAAQLIARALDLATGFVEAAVQAPHLLRKHTAAVLAAAADDEEAPLKILPRVLAALYASRHGLAEAEVWAIVELATGEPLTLPQRESISRVLRDVSFSVNGLLNFSHEDVKRAVFAHYIATPRAHVKAHKLLATYFGKLPPCARKLDALPFHLEVSGSWNKLRAALVDVRMFKLWWTSTHKTEFLALWVSLTQPYQPCAAGQRKLVTAEFDSTMRCATPARPTLDVVDEYIRGVDEYKFDYCPSDDELSGVILRIADFLLEFATLDASNDTPQFVHPQVPADDLASLGVPFLTKDKDGNSVLNTPHVDSQSVESAPRAPPADAQPNRAAAPLRSTYFYHRWMWTMFPWVAMANCGERFLRGAANQARDPHQASLASNSVSEAERLPKKGASPMSSAHVVAAAAAAVVGAKLPEIRKFAVNADLAPELRPGAAAALAIARSQTKFKTTQSSAANDEVDFTGGDDGAGESVEQLMADHFSHKLEALRATIQSSRGELDALRQERASLQRTLGQVHDQGNELGKMSVSTGDLEITLQSLVIRLEATQRGQRMSKLLHDNYDCVRLMCERHPAHSTALISELEMKLAQDGLFVGEVRRRLRESQFEGRGFTNATKVLQKGSLEMSVLQNAMLTQRIQQRELLQLPAPALAQEIDVPLNTSRFSKSLSSKAVSEDAEESTEAVWEARGDEIRARTFIPDVGDFYGKFHTAQILQSQLQALHFAAEARQRSLKEHLLGVEAERERVRTDSQSKLGTTSREARALQARLRTSRHAHKQSRENALAAERLKRDAFAGLQHVCTTLGVPPPDADTPVAEVVHAVESVLDALIEEKDKAAQRTADASQSLRDDELKARSPELEAALDQFEMPKALIAHRLTGKPKDDPAALANDSNDAAVPSRTDVKRDAQKSVRAEQRRQARLVGVPEK